MTTSERPTIKRAIAAHAIGQLGFVRPMASPRQSLHEAVQDGRIFIELINYPMLFELKATPAEYWAGLQLAIAHGWLTLDRSGTYVRFTQTG